MIVGCSVDSVADAVRAVHQGLRHLDPVAAHRIAESMFHEPLTGRETQVLQLVATGCANKVIAARLQIGVGTVKTHMRSVLDKLDVASRTEAAAVAHRRGLLREAQGAIGAEPHRSTSKPGASIAQGLSLRSRRLERRARRGCRPRPPAADGRPARSGRRAMAVQAEAPYRLARRPASAAVDARAVRAA